jgi:hypothetical protein
LENEREALQMFYSGTRIAKLDDTSVTDREREY